MHISNSNSPASGALFVSDDGSATPLSSGTTARICSNGGSASYAVLELQTGSASWELRNSGNLIHKFAGRQGQVIGSTDGSGAYIMLDGQAGNPLSSGSDYMYMEHASNGDFEMWNGSSSVTTTKFMDVTPEGYVNNPKQPSFACYRNQSVWNVNGAVMQFNTTRHNTGNHYDTSTGKFTAPVAVSYQFNFFSIYRGNHTSAHVYIRKNGSGINGGYVHFTFYDLGNNWDNVSLSTVLYLAKDDYVEMYSPNNVDWHGNNWQCFSGYLLG